MLWHNAMYACEYVRLSGPYLNGGRSRSAVGLKSF